MKLSTMLKIKKKQAWSTCLYVLDVHFKSIFYFYVYSYKKLLNVLAINNKHDTWFLV